MSDSPSDNTKKVGRSLLSIAGIVAVATLLSKVFGLLRQMAIAAAFGAGPAYDAYNYAYVVPGFLLILLGGINGPFHSAIVSVLSKRKSEEAAPLLETVNTLVGILLLGVSVLLFVFAEPLINLYAPGLGNTAQGIATRNIAIEQFRIMAPMALLSGLIGIGFGALNASDQFWLPSISPLLSSLTVLIGIGGMAVVLRDRIFEPQNLLLGGQVLAYSTLAGALLQWLVQVPAQLRSGLGGLRLRFDFRQPGVKEIVQIMVPATFSSGMMQINVYTDLFFASGIPQAASALGYATLLVQTPLGIFSNVILVPLLPMFSRLADPHDWPELKLRIRQGMMLTAITMLPLSALMMALAFPLVRIVYERYAFTSDTSQLVASVLVAYGLGMFVYLGRDVLVRVFYALGDGDTPFRISVVNIGINAGLDYLLVKPFGAPGLVLATVLVNLISMVVLLWYLNRKLYGFPWREWGIPLLQLVVISAIAGLSSWGILNGSQYILGDRGLWVLLLQVCLAGAAGLVVFAILVMRLDLPEVKTLVERLKQRFFKSKS
ncbi:murein biosynthesis integral membrane protein MurJ [Pseudanabaena sp. PCC 6802]|uniref:murein biosynthesis integral membrane protein MurJ n=1 Tax=Pseudanabaena sp. PCC 6802 TaxID=118173 RepID=UPI000382D9B6|nr:murein biosynthesis integral membrane protein MurJ [Pseudanabaena sp. PCC 6802]